MTPSQTRGLESALAQTANVFAAKRIQAVLMADALEPVIKITRLTNFSRSRIFGLRQDYLAHGLKAVLSKPKKVKQLLNRRQLKEIETVLLKSKPLDFNYNSPFWSTSILADLVWDKFSVKYKSRTSYYLLFKRVKFTFHKPGRVFEKRNETEVRKWRAKAKKVVKAAWNNSRIVILAGDEMILSTQTTFQKIWLPANQFPKIQVSNTRKTKSLYGFLNIKTGTEHAFVANWQNMHITARVLKQVRQIYPGKQILLLWDSPGWHKGSKVTEFIQKDGHIQVVYFPRYSPEENPQEHVWKEGRSQVTHNQFISDIDQTAKDFAAYLNHTKFKYSLLGFSPI